MEQKIFYRVSNVETEQGLWYDFQGNFTGLIHNEFSFCMNKDLPMPEDENIKGWLSTTDTLEDLYNWFTLEDIDKLKKHGYDIHRYVATNYKEHQGHFIICQKTSILLKE